MPYIGRDENPDYEEVLAKDISAVWTDLYELTMGQALYFEGKHNQQTTFQAFVRSMPYNGSYLVTAGQNIIFEWLDKFWKFTEADIRFLARKITIDPTTQKTVKVFKPEFLEFLKQSKLEITVDAMPEGELAFPSEPVYKISGPLWQCLAVESAILNAMNSQSNFATYASILNTAAKGKPVVDFGLRRAHSIGGLESTRGAFVGGVSASSNCLAERYYGINTVGTMAHAYVMVHEDEFSAFQAWAKYSPHLSVFLPDTYRTETGIDNAIRACQEAGIKMAGLRFDSGDLAYHSRDGRAAADAAGYPSAIMMASNGLNAKTINSFPDQNAQIDVYAVGTDLATVAENPALGGVYKAANMYENGMTHQEIMALKKVVRSGAVAPEDIRDKVNDLMKLSEDAGKMTYPGELDLIRYLKEKDGHLLFDGGTLYPEWSVDPLSMENPADNFGGILNRDILSVDPKKKFLVGMEQNKDYLAKVYKKGTRAYRPLKRMFEEGRLVGDIETIQLARARALGRMEMLDASHKRLLNPHRYIVGVERGLMERQGAMASHLYRTGNALEANRVVSGSGKSG